MPKSTLNATVCHSCKLCASSILIPEAGEGGDSWGGVTFDGWQRERGVSGVDGGYIPDLSAHSMILLVAVIFPARLLAKLIVTRPLIQLWYLCIKHCCTFTRGEWAQLGLLFSFWAPWLTSHVLKRQTATGWRFWAPQETKHVTLSSKQHYNFGWNYVHLWFKKKYIVVVWGHTTTWRHVT